MNESAIAQDELICENLNVWYGKTHILKNISLGIPKNKITTIIGPSGCGKTTLLKSFNRLIEITHEAKVTGKILLNGQNIMAPDVHAACLRKKMGLLAQRPSPLPMSIYSNVAYGPKIHGIRSRKKLDDIVINNLKLANLYEEVKDRLHEPASRLSIGQQQRLCLARALAVEPEILLGDELTSALDPMSTKFIEEQLIQLKQNYTIVIVTHILRQAKRLADHVVFLYLGELIECGPAPDFFSNPTKKMTRDYIDGTIS